MSSAQPLSDPAPPPERPLAVQAAPAQAKTSGSSCLNCGATLGGEYCADCGQRHREGAPSLGHVLGEFADDYLHLDSKLPRTLWALLARPGHLTQAFLSGARARYVGPFKLYVLCSVIFFGLQALGPSWARQAPVRPEAEKPIEIETSKKAPGPARWVERALKAKIDHKRPSEVNKMAARAVAGYLPNGMLVLLPLVALLFKFLNRRRYYAEHFVFALHLHAVGFLAFALMVVAQTSWVGMPMLLALAVYVVIAFKRVYAQSWPRTLFKLGAVALTYPLMLGTMVGLVAVVGIWFGT